MYKGAFFDLDGTLADTFGDIAASVNLFLREEGFPPRSKEELLAAISFGRRDFIARALPYHVPSEQLDSLVASYTQIYQLHYLDTTRPYAGMPELLEKLKDAGIVTAVVTNKAHPNAVKMIETIFPAGLFAGVWGLSRFPAKPDPSIALEAAHKLGLSPEECVFIGDSELDILTARNAGMTSIGVSWGYRSETLLQEAGADSVAHSVEELEALILGDPAPVC